VRFPLALTLQTRVGRRIALLFVVSALLPVGVLAVEGYRQVRSQLVAQATSQLEQAAKNVGMGLLDQLRGAEATLLAVVDEIGGADSRPAHGAVASQVARRTFASLAVVRRGGTRVYWGSAPAGGLSADELRALATGRRVLRVDSTGAQPWLVGALPGGSQVWGAIDRSYLLRGASDRARIGDTDSYLCIRTVGTPAPLLCAARPAPADYLSARWNVFLAYGFASPPWRVDVAQSMADTLEPIKTFRRTFLLSMVVVLGLVVLLSSVQVRRSLQPLAALGQGTRRLAQRDFSGTVSVSSGDEFEELAASFNHMAGEMDQHFRTMAAANAIDEAALDGRRADEVAATAAGRLRDVLRGSTVDVLVAGDRADDGWLRVSASDGGVHAGDPVRLPAADLARLRDARGQWLEAGGDGFTWLRRFADGRVMLFPLVSHEEFVGVIALHGNGAVPDERLRAARQLADQLALGLSNARLIVRLNGLSYGALSALARTVDANSPWTSGHSERVTALSLRIADRIGLPMGDVRTLYRGGLLHDIGKIGVPTYILDLAGPLTPNEMAQMRRHPGLGAKILAPIAAFADAIPIVLYHHERIDGAGYPEGIGGNEIPYLARLLSVADVYDALVSDRPYRVGWSPTLAVETIVADAGAGFDPPMVEAFLAVMKDEGDAARFVAPPPELAMLPQ